MKKIYCAGPLFTPKEREEMGEIADMLESANYRTFLPQRDGLEMGSLSAVLVAKGISVERANRLLARTIFLIDTFQIMDSDGFVLNLNGRVPDEGAMVEAGIAWAHGKPVVIYKNDYRSVFNGFDNPLVAGLSAFTTQCGIDKIPCAFNQIFASDEPSLGWVPNWENHTIYRRGKRLHEFFSDQGVDRLDADWLHEVLQGA